MSEMTFDDAAAALSTASLEDAGESTTPASDELALIQQAAAENTPAPAQSDAPQAPTPAAPAAEESFTSIDPALLPPELQTTYKSMQADYTRKQQALAAERTQYEQYGPPEEIQAARELYQAIQDPSNWEQLHAELTVAMQEQGLTPAQAAVAATQTLTEQTGAPAATGAPDLAPFLADPELSPLAQHVQALQARLDEQENAAAEAAYARQVEQEQMALVGEYQRQEMAIRQNNPSYTDGDIDAIYELSSFHNGNLLQAQQRYDAIYEDRFARYIAAKGGAAGTPGLGSPNAASSDAPQGPILDADQAHRAGLAALAALEAAGQ